MKTKEAMSRLSKGELLCKGHTPEGPTYFLHPSRRTLRADIAEKIIERPDIVPGCDGLFADAPQTWKLGQ